MSATIRALLLATVAIETTAFVLLFFEKPEIRFEAISSLVAAIGFILLAALAGLVLEFTWDVAKWLYDKMGEYDAARSGPEGE